VNWLLLRGLVREKRHWGDFPERLARATGGEVLTLDLPGVGTERDRPSPTTIEGIVADLRERFGKPEGEWSLFAPSLGGMIALKWGEVAPEDFRQIMVCNTSARDLAGPFQRFSPFALWTALRGVLRRDLEARERGVLALVANTPEALAMAPSFARFAAERPIGRMVLVRQLLAGAQARAPQRLDVPLTVLASNGDRLCAPIASRRLAARLGAPLHVHPTAGHDLPLDDAAWVIARMCDAGVAASSDARATE
jgi:pimeloyl-ACP methyl ester carboxylesterase